MDNSTLIRLYTSTISHIKAHAWAGESLDATVRRLVGVVPRVDLRRGAPAVRDGVVMVSRVPRETKYKAFHEAKLNQRLSLPYQENPDGTFKHGGMRNTMAVRRVEQATGFKFVEVPAPFAEGNIYIRVK